DPRVTRQGSGEQAVARVLGHVRQDLEARLEREHLMTVQRAPVSVALRPPALEVDELLGVACEPLILVGRNTLSPLGARRTLRADLRRGHRRCLLPLTLSAPVRADGSRSSASPCSMPLQRISRSGTE